MPHSTDYAGVRVLLFSRHVCRFDWLEIIHYFIVVTWNLKYVWQNQEDIIFLFFFGERGGGSEGYGVSTFSTKVWNPYVIFFGRIFKEIKSSLFKKVGTFLSKNLYFSLSHSLYHSLSLTLSAEIASCIFHSFFVISSLLFLLNMYLQH